MYTEGVDEFNESENKPPRTYVSTGGQDSLKLQRENERLKKSLEKEQFFNRLLDQELKDLKASRENGSGIDAESLRPNGVPRGTFNLVLVIALALGVFAVYTTFFAHTSPSLPKPLASVEAPATVAPVKDSVPNIVSGRKSAPPAARQLSPVVTEKAVATREPKNNKPKASAAVTSAVADDVTEQVPEATTAADPEPVAAQPAPAERTVVGKYMVSSKANFYSAPDGNTLRSYFISPGADKVVNALEDKNGFIYVEFKNDVGYVTKGWLSKADLSKQ